MNKAVNLWASASHALEYLARADRIPHRAEGEGVLLEFLPRRLSRVLDLGSGDGRLLGLIRLERPHAEAVAIDFSDVMLERLHTRFANERTVTIVPHDLSAPLPDRIGTFDAVVSSFAIHHLAHDRKRALYREVWNRLKPGGVFCNLEHVASPSPRLHREFLAALGVLPEQEDPSNRLLDVDTQLRWLRDIGFVDVDCHWKWRELALIAGARAAR